MLVLGHIYGSAGRAAQAEEVLQDLERRYRRGEASSYDLALPLTDLGLRGEPRFMTLMDRLAFP